MKIFIAILLFLPITISNDPVTSDCMCNNIPLWGKVEVVDIDPDFRVRVVTIDPDLLIEETSIATKCGEWEFVDAFGDFTIQFVDIGEDFTIQYSDFPGLP